MNNKVKSILTMVALVFIGFIAGFHTHRYMAKEHFNKIKQFRPRTGLGERILNNLNMDAQDKEKIKPIVDKYATQLIDLSVNYHQQKTPIFEAFQTELNPLLNDVQKEQLSIIINKMSRSPHKVKKEK